MHRANRSGNIRGVGVHRAGASGVTLLEFIIAMSIGILVVTMALSGMSTMNRFLGRMEQKTVVSGEAKLLNEYISESLRDVGGGGLRPYAALWVDNNYQSHGADRIISARLQNYASQCTISTVAGSLLTGMIDSGGSCCLSSAYLDRQVILLSGTSDGQSHWASKRVTHVNLPMCTATLAPGLASTLDVAPLLGTAWAGGLIAVVNLQIVWLDTQSHQLKVDDDYNQDGVIETRVVADRVLDLQAALGYDAPPWNWRMTDTGGNDDEWLFNAFGDVLGGGGTQGLSAAARVDLRMIRFGVTVGSAVRGFHTEQSHRLFDGPTVTVSNQILASFTSTIGLRNYAIMR